MKRNFCHVVAPSTDAASYMSAGIARRPAIRISVQKGSDFQMWTRMASVSAMYGSLSQLGPSFPVRSKMSELMSPHSGFSMNRNDRIVGIDGTAHGMMKSSDSHLIQVRAWMKNPESRSAISILTLMPMTRNTSVLTTDRANTGSFHSLT